MEQEFILRKEEETYQKRLYTLSVERAIKRMAMEYSFDKKISYEQALEKVKKFYQETE